MTVPIDLAALRAFVEKAIADPTGYCNVINEQWARTILALLDRLAAAEAHAAELRAALANLDALIQNTPPNEHLPEESEVYLRARDAIASTGSEAAAALRAAEEVVAGMPYIMGDPGIGQHNKLRDAIAAWRAGRKGSDA